VTMLVGRIFLLILMIFAAKIRFPKPKVVSASEILQFVPVQLKSLDTLVQILLIDIFDSQFS
jgi:hypothetical protein